MNRFPRDIFLHPWSGCASPPVFPPLTTFTPPVSGDCPSTRSLFRNCSPLTLHAPVLWSRLTSILTQKCTFKN